MAKDTFVCNKINLDKHPNLEINLHPNSQKEIKIPVSIREMELYTFKCKRDTD